MVSQSLGQLHSIPSEKFLLNIDRSDVGFIPLISTGKMHFLINLTSYYLLTLLTFHFG